MVFKEYVERRRESREKVKPMNNGETLASCNSNILLTGNQERKRNINLAQDSCLKFKMHENLMNGKILESSKQNIS